MSRWLLTLSSETVSNFKTQLLIFDCRFSCTDRSCLSKKQKQLRRWPAVWTSNGRRLRFKKLHLKLLSKDSFPPYQQFRLQDFLPSTFFFFPFFAQNSRIWILGLTFCVVLLPLFVESTSAHKSAFVNVYKILLEIQVLRGKAVEVLYEVAHNACFSRKCFYYQKRL